MASPSKRVAKRFGARSTTPTSPTRASPRNKNKHPGPGQTVRPRIKLLLSSPLSDENVASAETDLGDNMDSSMKKTPRLKLNIYKKSEPGGPSKTINEEHADHEAQSSSTPSENKKAQLPVQKGPILRLTVTPKNKANTTGTAKEGKDQDAGITGHINEVEAVAGNIRGVLEDEQEFQHEIIGQPGVQSLSDKNAGILAGLQRMAAEQFQFDVENETVPQALSFGNAPPNQIWTQEEVAKDIKVGTVFPLPRIYGEHHNIATLVESSNPFENEIETENRTDKSKGKGTNKEKANGKGKAKETGMGGKIKDVKMVKEKVPEETSIWDQMHFTEEGYYDGSDLNNRFQLPQTSQPLGGVMASEEVLSSIPETIQVVRKPDDEALLPSVFSRIPASEEETNYYALAGLDYSPWDVDESERELLELIGRPHDY